MSIPKERILRFIHENKPAGGCRVLSVGDECKCPLCDMDRFIATIAWYSEQSEAIARYSREKKYEAIEACVVALSLDAGERGKKITG